MSKTGLIGDDAIAWAAKICDVDVVAAYPITPQTFIVETFSNFVANGEVNTEFICVESEHSAMSACVAASATGARVFTASSSQGLALMHEVLYVASGMRMPVVMGVATRTLSAPLNIHGDQSDVMGSRDSGWVMIFTENAQEAYDTTLMAFKLAEDPQVSLPVMVCVDGFITSHCMEGVEMTDEKAVAKFLPPRKAAHTLDPAKPMTFGPLALPEYYMEAKRQQEEALRVAEKKFDAVQAEFARAFGRKYGSVETFGMGDAKSALVCTASTAGTARHVARELRKKGKKVGVIKLRLYRPFPAEKLRKETKRVKSLIVLDRAASPGATGGPIATDVRSALFGQKVHVKGYVFGLGGRDITTKEIAALFEEGLKIAGGKKAGPDGWLNVREG